jgi:hypothetical protein
MGWYSQTPKDAPLKAGGLWFASAPRRRSTHRGFSPGRIVPPPMRLLTRPTWSASSSVK